MAKMFYTMEETKAALGRNEEDIKQLAREGRLREFRDGPRLMFKADQVEQLKGEIGTGGETALGSDTGAPIGLAGDSRGGSSVLSMADSFSGKPATAGDTAFADPGSGSLSGSVGGVPSPAKGDTRMGSGLGSGLTGSGLPGSGLTGTGISSAGGTRGGVTVFDVEDRDRADPSAQTQISPGAEHGGPPMEAVGSGSGLLDLTRESDDTSLGAVFDELGPGGSTAGGSGRRSASQIAASALGGSAIASPMAGQETQAGEVAVVQERGRVVAAPVYIEAPDPVANGLGFASLGGAIVLAVGMFILGSAVLGYHPDLLKTLTEGGMMYLGIGAGLIIVLFIAGFVTGRGRTA